MSVHCLFIALMSRLLRFSARASLKDMSAQIAAGNQPIKVICSTRQMMPASTFPLSKKDNQGRSIASSVISGYMCSFTH